LLHAAAQARAFLVEGAGRRFDVLPNSLKAHNTVIRSPDGRIIQYGGAIRLVDLHRKATPKSPLKIPESFMTIGISLPQFDISGRVTGGTSYFQGIE
jgi:CO/xanthine dehydrogenase Mo-binding subunit